MPCVVCGQGDTRWNGAFRRGRHGVEIPFDVYCDRCFGRLRRKADRLRDRIAEFAAIRKEVNQVAKELKCLSRQRAGSALS